jgi:hypothetical protein
MRRSGIDVIAVLVGRLLFAQAIAAQPMVEVRPEAPGIVTALARSGAATAAAWPGYAPPAEYLLCQGTDLTLLIAREPPGSELGSAPVRTVAVVDAPEIHVYRGRLAGLPTHCFTLRFMYRGRQILAFPMIDSAYSVRDPRRVTAVAVLHEWFHRFQRNVFRGTVGALPAWRFDVHEAPPTLPAELMGSAAFQEGARRERELLALAFEAPSADSLRRTLIGYIATRAARMRLLPIALRGVEPHEERKEGTAQYAAYRAAIGAGNASAPALLSVVREDLLTPLDFTGSAEASGRTWRNWHVYASGAAIGLVLDRLGCDWREAVSAGYSMFAVLVQGVGFVGDLGDVITPVAREQLLSCRTGTT